MPEISSRQHPLVKSFKAAARGEDERLLLDGWHLIHDALEAGLEFDTAALTRTPHDEEQVALVERLTRVSATGVVYVSTAVMDALSPVRTPSGIVALAHRPDVTLPQLLVPPPPLVVIAADLQDPGNVGAVVRSAEAGGATGVVVTGASADPWSWKALRAAMGSTFRLPVVRHGDTVAMQKTLGARGVKVLATVPRGGMSLYDVDLTGSVALLVGSEGSGVGSALLSRVDGLISIPMQEPVDSLNVAVAAGLLVYEARRQRMMSS